VIYPEIFEQKTGFDKIRTLVGEKCLSTAGRERVDEMAFSDEPAVVSAHLEQTEEFVRILGSDKVFPSDHYIDLRTALNRIRPEGTFLDEKELFDLKHSLQTVCDIVRFFGTDENRTMYPVLTALAGNIPVFPKLVQRIDTVLDKYGKMKDGASEALMRIRKEINATVGSISRNLQSILRTAQAEGLVDKDASPAMRDGRLVIPVAPAFKRKIRGIVHDESASGKTVYIEPEVVVEANNRVRELEGEERREIIRILTEQTDLIRPLTPDILHSYTFMATIDFIRAKALFAIDIQAIKPQLGERPLIDWRNAVHPLLYLSHRKQHKPVEPLDIVLDDKNRLLIISGPNAGGKSVCLKTVGLLQYMLQCGMMIPVHERSHTGLFKKLFIDIGDEQSIENDLSTYSSHLTNMKFFVKHSDGNTLLLIDEFGGGTEPLIGGAIAEALLEQFNRNRSFGIITTHYPNLKQYAEETEGLVNGAMLYDRHLMQPLFKLSVGNPGSSFAIEIARKTGLPEEVIACAADKAGAGYVEKDKYLQDIARDKRYWESKRQNIRRQEKRLEELSARYEQDIEAVDKQRREILNTAKDEAKRIIAEANARIEQTIREIREAQAEKERTKSARRELDKFTTSVQEETPGNRAAFRTKKKQVPPTANKQAANRRNDKPAVDRETLAVNDSVRIRGQQAIGTVIELNGKQAVIVFGMIKSTVKLEQIEKVSPSQAKKEVGKSMFSGSQTVDSMYEKQLHFKQDIDVRGMRGDEALQAVAYFIDDAIQVAAGRVRILHGTGTGVLRELIRNYLHSVPGVKRLQDEDVRFGGAGITVADLD
jgi:DNA mismatch repair protein MutS2